MTSLPVLSEPLLETSACSRLRILNLLGEPLPGSKRFRPLPGTLERRVAPLDLVPTELSEVDTKEESHWILPEAPKRPPSQTPPSLQLEMHAILGKYMGGGRVGPVFALNNVKVPGIPDNTIPPLVVKIARRDRAASLAREAWFYDEMECIQGSVVPRCYGWFHIDLAAGERIPVLERFATDSDFTEDDAECLQDGHEFNAYKPLHPVLKELRESRTVLSVLVLEEVGLRLTIGRALSKSQREDIQDLYMQLGHLGIGVAGDIRWENLAWKHPSVPNKTSPLIKREHAFRLIDFDQAFKVDWSLNYFAFNNRPAVVGVLENVRYADCGPRWYPEDQLIEVKWREKAYANWCFSRDYPLST